MESEAWKRGYDDFFLGKDLRDCPFPRNSIAACDWERGNWDGYDDYTRKKREASEEDGR
jgi:hypothetical protein